MHRNRSHSATIPPCTAVFACVCACRWMRMRASNEDAAQGFSTRGVGREKSTAFMNKRETRWGSATKKNLYIEEAREINQLTQLGICCRRHHDRRPTATLQTVGRSLGTLQSNPTNHSDARSSSKTPCCHVVHIR